MIVAGVDLSMTSTGVALVNLARGETTVHRIKSAGSKGDSLNQRHARLSGIVRQIVELTDGAGLVAIEGPSYGSKSPNSHDRSGLWWLLQDDVRLSSDVPIVEIPPTTRAKYATGKGNAGKDDVLLAVDRRYGDLVKVTGNDEADALVLAAMGCRYLGFPIDDPLPKLNLAAMTGVAWPLKEAS